MTIISQDIISSKCQNKNEHFYQDSESFKMVKEYFDQYQHLVSSESAYNQLNGGRVGLLLIQAILCSAKKDENFEKTLIHNFNLIVNETLFLNEKLTWLPPYQQNQNGQNLFLRNIGIYLGLSIVHQYYFQEDNIYFLLKHISFEVELNEVSSYKHRKLLKQLFDSDAKDIKLADIHKLICYYQQSNNQVVLESIICFIIIGDFLKEKSVNGIIQNIEKLNDPFIKVLLIACQQQKTVQEHRFIFSENVICDIMKKKFISLYQYCGEDFMNVTIKEKQLDRSLNPLLWLRTISNEYPQKTRLFKNIIWREKLLLKMPKDLFTLANNNLSKCESSNNLLLDIYKGDIKSVFDMKLRIDISKINSFFSSFWIGILAIKNFKEINHEKKIVEFRKTHQYSRFTILLTKRFDKVISWQGRSFKDNDEIEFLYYFFEDFHSPNDYKSTFKEKALEDLKILELIFWCLELGIIESC
jgi:hypothetical protein